jgi:hypothetical protein
MIHHKACHQYGLDTLIFKACKHNTSTDYYFFIWDYCFSKSKISSNFFHEKCNINNTWNYALQFEDTTKYSIVENSPKYGFGDYKVRQIDKQENYIVKAISHFYSCEKYGQCQKISHNDIPTIDTTKYIIQPMLKSNKGEELNVFVFKNFNKDCIHLFGFLSIFNAANYVNRKNDRGCQFQYCDLKTVFGEKNMNNLKEYCKSIHLDYGRVELINDINRGWCIIDINNSPGGGPLSNTVYKLYVQLFNDL